MSLRIQAKQITPPTNPQISDWHAGAGAFQGQLGFFMIYDHALTDAEIAYNYEILRSRYGL